MDGLRSEMLEARQETGWGGVFFLHAELQRTEGGKREVDETRKLVRRGLKETQESDKSALAARGATYGEHTKPDSAAE